MTAVGMFAGRGDVVLAMLLAVALGTLLGWWTRGKRDALAAWWRQRRLTK